MSDFGTNMSFVRYISGQPHSVEIPTADDFAFEVERVHGAKAVQPSAVLKQVAVRQYRDSNAAKKERKAAIVAQQVMRSKVVCVDEKVSVEQARELMLAHHFHHLPVLRADCLVGILSDRDLLSPKARPKERVSVVMAHDVLTARPEARLADIARVMVSHAVGCVPIVNERNNVTGIVTSTDLLRCIMLHAPIDLWV